MTGVTNRRAGDHMKYCTDVAGQSDGDAMMLIIERATGAPCPCKSGRACPLDTAGTFVSDAPASASPC